MASRKSIDRLIRRYLDPSRPWDAAAEASLRDLIRDDMDARARYREAVIAHRVMVGADPEFPSGFETGRMADAVVDATAPAAAQVIWWRVAAPWAAALAAGVAAVMLVVGPFGAEVVNPTNPTAPLTDLRTRGGAATAATVGLGLSGVSRANPTDEYEVVAGGGVRLGDFLRVYTTNERPGVDHLFVLVLQQGRAPIWYAPMPPEQNASVALGQGRSRMLEAEYAVDAERYASGPARAIALFTAEPITVDRLTPHLDDGLSTGEPEAAARKLAGDLGLRAPSEVVVIPFAILPAGGAGGR